MFREDRMKKGNIKWPIIKSEFIENNLTNIVVQVNGKKRSIISVEKNLEEKIINRKNKTR